MTKEETLDQAQALLERAYVQTRSALALMQATFADVDERTYRDVLHALGRARSELGAKRLADRWEASLGDAKGEKP